MRLFQYYVTRFRLQPIDNYTAYLKKYIISIFIVLMSQFTSTGKNFVTRLNDIVIAWLSNHLVVSLISLCNSIYYYQILTSILPNNMALPSSLVYLQIAWLIEIILT